MKIKNIFLAVLFSLAAVTVFLYIFSAHIFIYTASKYNDFDVSYKNLKNHFYRELVFTDLKVIKNENAIGISSKRAYIEPVFGAGFIWPAAIKINLRDVSFVTGDSGQKAQYGDLDQLISAPFKSHWIYKEISGEVIPIKGGIRVKDLVARSDDIRLSFTGDIYYNNIIDVSTTIYFSNRLTAKIPDIMLNTVLKDENDGWKSLSVNLKGDYSSPSIQVTGKQFKLNIRSVTVTPKKDN